MSTTDATSTPTCTVEPSSSTSPEVVVIDAPSSARRASGVFVCSRTDSEHDNHDGNGNDDNTDGKHSPVISCARSEEEFVINPVNEESARREVSASLPSSRPRPLQPPSEGGNEGGNRMITSIAITPTTAAAPTQTVAGVAEHRAEISQDETTATSTFTTMESGEHDDSASSIPLPPLTDSEEISLLASPSGDDHDGDDTGKYHDDGADDRAENQTYLEEREMRRKLMDMESSFLPEPSTIELASGDRDVGVDDTYLLGVPIANSEREAESRQLRRPGNHNEETGESQESFPPTPSGGLDGEDEETTLDLNIVSPDVHGDGDVRDRSLDTERIPSSPSAAAAARTGLRQFAIRSEFASAQQRPSENAQNSDIEDSLQPPSSHSTTASRNLSPVRPRLFQSSGTSVDGDLASRTPTATARKGSRPKYLNSRQSTHRLSHSSAASTNTDTTTSDATMGFDYALQSGGAAPGVSTSVPSARRNNTLTRTISLGSMASGISAYSDEQVVERRLASGATDGGLQTLAEEESSLSQSKAGSAVDDTAGEDVSPLTPKAKPRNPNPALTDTVVTAERIRDTPFQSTFARQFREEHGIFSPDKRKGVPTPVFTRSGRTMTLKEQSSTIDRLSKENFDLKMRIHFLNEALNKRSEEGIKEMISENVELKSDKLKLQKDNQSLKRKVRELEKQLKDRDQQSDKGSTANHDPEGSDDEYRDRAAAHEEEITSLRERIEVYEVEVERLRSEGVARETEKRRLAEMVKSLSENRAAGSEVGAREERDMWKDMLDAETAAREQAEEENKRLRDEMLRMKAEIMTGIPSERTAQRSGLGSVVSQTTISDRDHHTRTTAAGSSVTSTLVELELLKQENAELRKEVSAQTSMLTSRNREKERLYQEIEELKLGQRRDGGRSVAGDSILDRSASRAHMRPSSRGSGETGTSRISESAREDLEIRNGQLRDQVSALKLENQAARAQVEEYVEELETMEKAYANDMRRAEEELDRLLLERDELMQERDQAWKIAEERDNAFQDLRAEAEEEIAAISDELQQKIDECQRLDEELRAQDENLKVLQAEMRAASEGIIRLEEDAQNNLLKVQAVQRELEDSNNEIESLEKSLFEANTKVQRLTVQIESSQNEIAFLREEQDADKIKIGDLESELKTCEMNLRSERDKTRELEARLADERHQREVVVGKEKQEVQRVMNELNREASAAKEEVRRLKKNLSTQEIETNSWRERLLDLEKNLREALGDLNGSRSSLIANIVKLQKELESTALELESTRSKLSEKETLLRNRDALLESHGLESRKLAELLERERQGRRADKQSFEQALKSHHQASRTITQSNSRISELESARNQERKRYSTLEQQFRDQLNERNAMLLTIWKRLSTMCGPDWAHSNSLINGNLPSQEVIGNILFWPGFSRNLLLAVRTLENVFSGFKNRIKAVERDLTKQYQTLEHTLSLRIKKLDRLDEAMISMRAQQHSRSNSTSSPELAKLRGENRLLKAELNLLQSNSRGRGAAMAGARTPNSPRSPRPLGVADTGVDADTPTSLARHNSASVVEKTSASPLPRSDRGISRSSTGVVAHPSQYSSSSSTVATNNPGALVQSIRPPGNAHSESGSGGGGGSEKWIHRLHDLERRLKAEREARLLDRSGARKRLEERDAENQKLRAQLERERVRKAVVVSATGADGQAGNEEGEKDTSGGGGGAAPPRRRSTRNNSPRAEELDQSSKNERHASDTGDEDHGDEDASWSGSEGIVVDIEM